MLRTFKRGERVSVPFGAGESRVVAKVVAGPFRYTPDELEQNKRTNEEYGYSTKRMPKTYYVLRSGKLQQINCAITSMRKLSKRGR